MSKRCTIWLRCLGNRDVPEMDAQYEALIVKGAKRLAALVLENDRDEPDIQGESLQKAPESKAPGVRRNKRRGRVKEAVQCM